MWMPRVRFRTGLSIATLALAAATADAAGRASKEVTLDGRTNTRISLRQAAPEAPTHLYVSTLDDELFFPDTVDLLLDGRSHRLRCQAEVVRSEPGFFSGGSPTCNRPSASYCELPSETLAELQAAERIAVRMGAARVDRQPTLLSSGQAKRLRKLRPSS